MTGMTISVRGVVAVVIGGPFHQDFQLLVAVTHFHVYINKISQNKEKNCKFDNLRE